MSEELPKNWTLCSFMEIFDIQGGTQPPKSEFIFEANPDYVRLLQIRDFGDKPVPTYIPFKPSLKFCKKDDILIGRYGASIGRICSGGEGAYNVALAKVLIPRSIDKRFVFFLLKSNSFQEPILKIERSAQDGFNKDDLKQIILPICPVNEQQRIVAKLEKLLAKVDACKERLEKIPAILKRFRQSVLAAACSGRLTAEWRAKNTHIASASGLIVSLNTPTPEKHFDVFELSSGYEIPASWAWAPLGKLGKLEGGGTPSKSETSFWNGNIPWVSPKDMKTDRIVDSIDHISNEAISKSSVKMIPKGSILFVTRGMILNHTLPVAVTDARTTINQDMKALVPEISSMAEYLFLASKSQSSKMLFAVKEATHGTRRIETQVLKNWAMPIPPIEEQHEIVRRVEALFKIADDIEKRYQKAKAHVDKLTQSILAKAFRGELVPQNPNDEPAAELLKRIQAERKNQEAETRPGRKSTRRRVKN